MKPGACLLALGIGLIAASPLVGADAPPSPNQPRIAPPPRPVSATHPTAAAPLKAVPSNQPRSIDDFLGWDHVDNQLAITNGETIAPFVFNVTNISKQEITVFGATGSCGCTDVRTPPLPWKLQPGDTGQVTANMNIAGKTGAVVKTVTINSDRGAKVLTVKAVITPPPATPEMAAVDRTKNQQLALTDRQAVFKNDCARCHAEPAKGKMGKELFAAACGICHTAEHRAEMVPDLHALPHETDAIFWRNWITYGKPGSLMPAFAQSEGGILSDEQITSLAEFLASTIPSKPSTSASAAPPASPATH